jgi:sugar lactone lactonase YvrE
VASSLVLSAPVPVPGTAAELGENPTWDLATGHLHWVDLPGGVLHETDPATGVDVATPMGGDCGFVVLGDPGLVVGVGSRVMTGTAGDLRELVDLDPDGGLRCNDTQVAPGGWLFSGLMHADRDKRPGAGKLLRVDPDGAATVVTEGITVPNGMGWSPDGTTMYHVDMTLNRIDRMDFDPATGAATDRRLAFSVEHGGSPDGLAVDVEGRLWVAVWGTPFVRCFEPDGTQAAVVELPVANLTSCAFGGADLSTLYITTARRGAQPGQDHAGFVFAVETGTAGQVPRHFGRG